MHGHGWLLVPSQYLWQEDPPTAAGGEDGSDSDSDDGAKGKGNAAEAAKPRAKGTRRKACERPEVRGNAEHAGPAAAHQLQASTSAAGGTSNMWYAYPARSPIRMGSTLVLLTVWVCGHVSR